MPKTPGSGATFWSWRQQLVGESRTSGISWKIMKNMKPGKVGKILKNNNIDICNFFTSLLFSEFWLLCQFSCFSWFFHWFCLSYSLPTSIVFTIMWSLLLTDKGWSIKLDMVYSDFIQENMITTKHGFSPYSGFTKIWSQPKLPLLYSFAMYSLRYNHTLLNCSELYCITLNFSVISITALESPLLL